MTVVFTVKTRDDSPWTTQNVISDPGWGWGMSISHSRDLVARIN
jgi:hypothetical protein